MVTYHDGWSRGHAEAAARIEALEVSLSDERHLRERREAELRDERATVARLRRLAHRILDLYEGAERSVIYEYGRDITGELGFLKQRCDQLVDQIDGQEGK